MQLWNSENYSLVFFFSGFLMKPSLPVMSLNFADLVIFNVFLASPSRIGETDGPTNDETHEHFPKVDGRKSSPKHQIKANFRIALFRTRLARISERAGSLIDSPSCVSMGRLT